MYKFYAGLRPLFLGMVFLLSHFNSSAQIRIPYGDDGILIQEKENGNQDYVLFGTDWDCRYISYFFVNGTDDLPGNDEHDAVRNAMATWSAQTNIDFIEACSAAQADIKISWESGDHGDNFPFLGPSGVLAHAFYPPPNGSLAGDIHFDEAEYWLFVGNNIGIDLETVALHELGHSLGLRHSDQDDEANVVMEETYEGPRRSLKQDDINGVQALYGPRENPISGSSQLCFSTRYTLEDFDCLPNGYTVTWSTSHNLQLVTGQGTGTIGVEPLANAGPAVVRVLIDNGCDQLEYSRWLTLIDCEDCCPNGAVYDGANCFFGINYPEGYDGFIWEDKFYTHPNCETCCPLGAEYDGAHCYYGVNYPAGYNGFIWENKFYVHPNCNISTDNDCCPPGSVFDEAHCYFGIEIPEGYDGFIYENGFYTHPVECYDFDRNERKVNVETVFEKLELAEPLLPRNAEKQNALMVYPNPSSGSFTIDLSSVFDQALQIDLLALNGQNVLSLGKSQLNPILTIDQELQAGVYFIRVTLSKGIETIRVVKM